MTEAKHTPKEWVAGSVMVDGRVPDDEAIVYVGGDADTGPEVEIIIRGPGAAHISGLIAAAPDLLHVAQRCLEMVDDGGGPPDWDWVRKVISKAIGA